ncbi:MAG: MFS transporter, partial [Ignavibacteria bacterium]
NKNFGKMSISSNLGFIAGPALAGLLGATVYKELLPVLAALLISLAALVVIFLYLPDSRPKSFSEDPEKASLKKVLGFEHKECFKIKDEQKISLKKCFKLPDVPYLLILYFLIFLGFNFFYTAFPIHALEKLGWSVSEMGIFFSVLSLIMVIVQGPVLSFASKRYSETNLIVYGNLILGTNFVMLYSSNTVLIYIAAVLFALGNGLMWPSLLSLLSKAAGDKYQGSVQGFASSFGSLASIIGLIAGGVLYAKTGAGTFIIAASVIYLVCFLSLRLYGVEKAIKLKTAE